MYPWLVHLLQLSGADGPDMVAANVTYRLIKAAEEFGARRPVLIESLTTDEAQMRDPLRRIPMAAVLRLLDAIAVETKNPTMHLTLASKIPPRGFSDIAYPILLAPSVITGLQAYIQMQPYLQSITKVSLDIEELPPKLKFAPVSGNVTLAAPAVEFTLAAFISVASGIRGDHVQPRQIRFAHYPRFDTKLYEEHFGCPVIFGATETEVEMPIAQLQAPAAMANPLLIYKISDHHMVIGKWLEEGKNHLATSYFCTLLQIDKSPVTLDRIASAFGMSGRTLRRKLVEEGMSFRDMVDNLRRSLFELYVEENRLFYGDIAQKLGYGELSALSRAQRRWAKQGSSA